MQKRQFTEHLASNNYILKADVNSQYWFGLSKKKIEKYVANFGEDFNIVLIGEDDVETDFYIIPYLAVKDLITTESLSITNKRERWVGDIHNHILSIRNTGIKRNISEYYSLSAASALKGKISNEVINDFAIENAKREIAVRLKQSLFRKRVLKNFNHMCCLTNITENDLLVASHIIPWSKQIENRLNPANGLCLSILYDKLFDSGYFSFDNDFRVILTTRINSLSTSLKESLYLINGKRIESKLKHQILPHAVKYHRENIYDKF